MAQGPDPSPFSSRVWAYSFCHFLRSFHFEDRILQTDHKESHSRVDILGTMAGVDDNETSKGSQSDSGANPNETVVISSREVPPMLPSVRQLVRQRAIRMFECAFGKVRFTLEACDDSYSFNTLTRPRGSLAPDVMETIVSGALLLIGY